MSIAPPGVQLLSRMIDNSTLEVQVVLTINGVTEDVTASPVGSPDGDWTASFEVPPNVPFSLEIVWSAVDVDGNRVDFALFSNDYMGVVQNQTAIDTSDDSYDMSASIFDDDGDGQSNYDELVAGTSAGGEAPSPIVAGPELLEFRTQVSESTGGEFNLLNIGPVTLNYTVESDQSWVTVNPVSASILSGENQIVDVVAQCDAGPGPRTGTLTISGDWGIESVSVSLECQTVTPPQEPMLGPVTPESLSLRARVTQRTGSEIRIRNIGTASLSYRLNSNRNWLTVSRDSGRIPADESQAVDVTASCSSRAETRNGRLTIDSNGGDDKTVSVSIECTELPMPMLDEVEPATLNLTAQVRESQTGRISFKNVGNASLDFTAFVTGNSMDWVTISPMSGRVRANDTQTLEVTAQCNESVGIRSTTLTIRGDGKEETVSVTIDCTEPPTGPIVTTNPDPLSFSTQVLESASGTIEIGNTGTASLDFAVSAGSDSSQWLMISPLNVTIGGNSSQTIDVLAQCDEVAGPRSTMISISSGAFQETVPVSIECNDDAPEPIITTSPDPLSFSTQVMESASGTIEIGNTGTASLDFAVSAGGDSSQWLMISPLNGSINGNSSQTIEVIAQCDEFAGPRSTMISISSGAFQETLLVSIECNDNAPEPNITTSPDPLSFSAQVLESASGTIEIGNTGTASLNFAVSAGGDSSQWLMISPLNGSINGNSRQIIDVLAQCNEVAGPRSTMISISSGAFQETLRVSIECDDAPPIEDPILTVNQDP